MTYDEARKIYEKRYKKPMIQDCWIAEIKRFHGTTTRKSWHSGKYEKECPKEIWSKLEEILKELNMI